MEFLSRQFSTSNSSVNLVLQSSESLAAGYDAQRTSSFTVYPLPFSPDQAFHEYRFDWTPDKVSFLADGQWLMDMTANVPTSPGYLVLNHWSNGDPKWSGGPPDRDAALTVSYVKAYFNSSDLARQRAFEERCGGGTGDAGRVCEIPDQVVPPDPQGLEGNVTARTFFFTRGVAQTVQDGNGTQSGNRASAAASVGLANGCKVLLWGIMLALTLQCWVF